MKALHKLYRSKIDLFLPLAAVLLGLLLMGLQKPIVVQASLPVPMPQTFLGEYSYDREIWYPLDAAADLSAMDGDLYLRGRFQEYIPKGARLYYYRDHIGSEISVNGKAIGLDTLMEMEKCGIALQPAMCCREWSFCFFEDGVPTNALVEIHLKNPHTFGNRNAYKSFLSTLCCTPNEQDYLAKNMVSLVRHYNVIGIVLVIAGVLLLCSALVSLFLRFPIGFTVIQTGLLAICFGSYVLLDTIDLSFRSENHILNTYGWQICMMYSVYLLGIMARDILEGKRKKAAICVNALSAAVNVTLILLAFTGVVLMYDTLHWWVMLQWVSCPVLVVCCGAEMFSADKQKRLSLAVFLLTFVCILLSCLGILDSIYSTGTLTKVAVILFFLLQFVQFAMNMMLNFKTSSQAYRLEKELEESRIALMLSQIQPHFIFNVLGTIRGLCREDPEQAWRGLGDFSTYLRANMSALTNAKLIPFEKELDHVQTYLRLEQMRLGEKMNVVYDIAQTDFFIPPLMLQPLVENAVKHGIFYKAEGGTITIRSRQTGGNLILSVHDDGIGFEAAAREEAYDQREHHGLANVRSRVEKMLGGTLRIESDPERGSTVTLEFPIEDRP